MSKEDTLERVRRVVLDIPGAVDMVFLEGTLKDEVVSSEREAEANGAAGGLMPFRNIGVWESLGRDVSLVIVFRSGPMVPSEDQLVIMMDDDGQILGEFVGEEKRRQLEGREGVHFLSEDFVIYSNLKANGPPIFVMPPLEFEPLCGVEGVTDLVAGSISTISDHMIRCMLGYKDTTHWTHLVGFNLCP